MPKNLKFVICSIKREKAIFNLIKKNIDFLKTNKILFTLPQKKEEIEKEYDIKKYQNYKKIILDNWKEKDDNFVKKLLTFFQKNLQKTKFIIEISNYGPMGFYNAKKRKITINLNNNFDPIKVVQHEMIHIMIEPYIKKFNIDYQKKEELVDIIFKILND